MMKANSLAVLGLSALFLAPDLTAAQILFPPYEGCLLPRTHPGSFWREQVRRELKLQQDEAAKLDVALGQIKESYRKEIEVLQELPLREVQEKFTKLRTTVREESLKAIESNLQAPRLKRLKQIELQQRGPEVFDDPVVQKALTLSEEQKTKIKDAADEAQE